MNPIRIDPPYWTDALLGPCVALAGCAVRGLADVIMSAVVTTCGTCLSTRAAEVRADNPFPQVIGIVVSDHRPPIMEKFLVGASREQFGPILDVYTSVFQNDLSAGKQIEFKSATKSFVRTYQFLASILPFSTTYWESLNTFLKFLTAKLLLPMTRTYQQATINIQLEGGVELEPMPASPGGGSPEPEIDDLSTILRSFHERYGTDWTDADKLKQFLFQGLPEVVKGDEQYQNAKNFSESAPNCVPLALLAFFTNFISAECTLHESDARAFSCSLSPIA